MLSLFYWLFLTIYRKLKAVFKNNIHMKGVILAGGTGSRLYPLTRLTNKHLLPVYNKHMIFYPLETLLKAGIQDILIISGPDHAGDFLRLLGSGKDFGARLHYEIQDEAGGIAQALSMAESFANGDSVTAILGDNLFEDDFSETIKSFTSGAQIFIKDVENPRRFGVAEIEGNDVIKITEKPKNPATNLAVTGLYIYDNKVYDIIRTLEPSDRNELEITDVSNAYITMRELQATMVSGYWSDMGTFESMHAASCFARKFESKTASIHGH